MSLLHTPKNLTTATLGYLKAMSFKSCTPRIKWLLEYRATIISSFFIQILKKYPIPAPEYLAILLSPRGTVLGGFTVGT